MIDGTRIKPHLLGGIGAKAMCCYETLDYVFYATCTCILSHTCPSPVAKRLLVDGDNTHERSSASTTCRKGSRVLDMLFTRSRLITRDGRSQIIPGNIPIARDCMRLIADYLRLIVQLVVRPFVSASIATRFWCNKKLLLRPSLVARLFAID